MVGESRKNKSSQLNMSWLAFDSILPYLDVHKRLSISICSPSFRNFEKQTYIYLDELEIETSKIRINNKDYKFGEILNIGKASELDDRKTKRIKAFIRKHNFGGGSGWRSMEGDLLEPGDIFLNRSYGSSLEQQKIEMMNKLRHSFMEELEKYSKSEIIINPLDVFEHSVTECDYEWPTELKTMFDRIYRSSPFIFRDIFRNDALLENVDCLQVQQDDLSEMYPNAFHLMKIKIEEMNRNADVRVSVLEKLAYPLVTVPHFNQFTVFQDSPEYYTRIPNGLSIRNAFKHFLSVILSGRRNIRVGNFRLKGRGIFPLPVGLEFDCEEADFSLFSDDGSATRVYETLVRRVNKINLPRLSGLIQYREAFNCEMVRNCKTLYIPSHRSDRIGSEFKFVNNETLFVGIRYQVLVDVIRSWTSNTDRRIGSKLFIAYTEYQFPSNTVEIRLGELRGMGFRMKEDCDQSMSLLQTGNKQVELTFLENNHSFPREFVQSDDFNHYCFLEVVSSKR